MNGDDDGDQRRVMKRKRSLSSSIDESDGSEKGQDESMAASSSLMMDDLSDVKTAAAAVVDDDDGSSEKKTKQSRVSTSSTSPSPFLSSSFAFFSPSFSTSTKATTNVHYDDVRGGVSEATASTAASDIEGGEGAVGVGVAEMTATGDDHSGTDQSETVQKAFMSFPFSTSSPSPSSSSTVGATNDGNDGDGDGVDATAANSTTSAAAVPTRQTLNQLCIDAIRALLPLQDRARLRQTVRAFTAPLQLPADNYVFIQIDAADSVGANGDVRVTVTVFNMRRQLVGVRRSSMVRLVADMRRIFDQLCTHRIKQLRLLANRHFSDDQQFRAALVAVHLLPRSFAEHLADSLSYHGNGPIYVETAHLRLHQYPPPSPWQNRNGVIVVATANAFPQHFLQLFMTRCSGHLLCLDLQTSRPTLSTLAAAVGQCQQLGRVRLACEGAELSPAEMALLSQSLDNAAAITSVWLLDEEAFSAVQDEWSTPDSVGTMVGYDHAWLPDSALRPATTLAVCGAFRCTPAAMQQLRGAVARMLQDLLVIKLGDVIAPLPLPDRQAFYADLFQLVQSRRADRQASIVLIGAHLNGPSAAQVRVMLGAASALFDDLYYAYLPRAVLAPYLIHDAQVRCNGHLVEKYRFTNDSCVVLVDMDCDWCQARAP